MLTEKEKKAWEALDNAATKAGGYLAKPKRPHVVEYDFIAMNEYRRENNKTDLTEEEYKMFLYDNPLTYTLI